MLKCFKSYLAYILDLYCVWLSNVALFWENYAKLYFGTRLLENEWNRESAFFGKSALFHEKVCFLANIECCPKFQEYALFILSIRLFDFFLMNFWNIWIHVLMKLVENPLVTQPNQSQVFIVKSVESFKDVFRTQ